MKALLIAIAVAGVALAGTVDAHAQQKGKKKDAFCAPNGMQVCMDRCNKVGGQGRHCGTYCNRQITDRCR